MAVLSEFSTNKLKSFASLRGGFATSESFQVSFTAKILPLSKIGIKPEITYLCENSSDFSHHVTTNSECNLKEKPLYLYCTREIVNSYLEKYSCLRNNNTKSINKDKKIRKVMNNKK